MGRKKNISNCKLADFFLLFRDTKWIFFFFLSQEKESSCVKPTTFLFWYVLGKKKKHFQLQTFLTDWVSPFTFPPGTWTHHTFGNNTTPPDLLLQWPDSCWDCCELGHAHTFPAPSWMVLERTPPLSPALTLSFKTSRPKTTTTKHTEISELKLLKRHVLVLDVRRSPLLSSSPEGMWRECESLSSRDRKQTQTSAAHMWGADGHS